MPIRGRRVGHRPHRARPTRRGADAHGTGAALRLRPRRALGVARRRRTACAPSPARHASILRTPVAAPGRGPARRSATFTVRDGRARAVRPHLSRVAPAVPEPVDAEAALRETERFWRDWVGAMRLRGAMVRGRHALAHHAQGADLSRRPAASWRRRPRRCRSSIGGRRNWDYRFCWLRDADVHVSCADERRLPRRGEGVARLAAASRRRQPRAGADHVRPRRRAAARPSGRCRGCPATRARSPVRVGNAAARSSSSTSTAK